MADNLLEYIHLLYYRMKIFDLMLYLLIMYLWMINLVSQLFSLYKNQD